MKNVQSGFTLLEILTVLSIALILLGIGVNIDLQYFKHNNFNSEKELIVQILEKARGQAQNNMFGSPFGVCFLHGDYITFRGKICVDDVNSESVEADLHIANTSNFSTIFGSIVFSQLSATTTDTIINMTDGTKSAQIHINNEGTILY